MSNHPTRNWKRRWTLDLDAQQARHQCGLVIHYLPRPTGGWDARSVNTAQAAATLEAAGETHIAARLHRLTWEALELLHLQNQGSD